MPAAKDEFEIVSHTAHGIDQQGAEHGMTVERRDSNHPNAGRSRPAFSIAETGSALAGGFIAASIVGLGGVQALAMSAAAGVGYVMLRHLPPLPSGHD